MFKAIKASKASKAEGIYFIRNNVKTLLKDYVSSHIKSFKLCLPVALP